MTRDSNLKLAMRCAEAGLSVFPCKADPSKRPLVKWRTDSTTDINTIKTWWKRWPRALVSIDLAKVELVVIDADRHEGAADGVTALAKLMREHGADLSSVPITRTPSNGFHLYFRQPEGEPLGNRTGDLPAGVDVRGYSITAPENVRPDGKTYRRLAHHPELIAAFKAGTIPIVPEWLIEIIRPPAPPTEPIASSLISVATVSSATPRPRSTAWRTSLRRRGRSPDATAP